MESHNKWSVDQEILEKLDVLAKVRETRDFYSESKPIYFTILKNEYNLLKRAFPEIEFTADARFKSFKSTYNKMLKQAKKGKNVYDYFGVRYTINSVNGSTDRKLLEDACREVMEYLMQTVPNTAEMQSRRKDYIASPKPNGYQCLHATRIHTLPRPFFSEVQVKASYMNTEEIDHRKYKPVSESKLVEDIPDMFEYIFDENGFCTGVTSLPLNKAYEKYFRKPFIEEHSTRTNTDANITI